jgi:hypothetical protein
MKANLVVFQLKKASYLQRIDQKVHSEVVKLTTRWQLSQGRLQLMKIKKRAVKHAT